MFERAGARNLAVLPGQTLEEVDHDAALRALSEAGGVWFGGGRQWRFVDAYAGTRALAEFRDVLRRGGVIGGSSAGASIQAEYLVRGSPLGNTTVMADGYQRGFAFLPGVAIDQHFTQRNRRPDMEALVRTWPQFLGIGVDESTALVVQGSQAEVLGEHSAWFFPRSTARDAPPVEVRAGERFDLLRGQRIAVDPAE
jgi:cyanophycinase